MLTFDEVLERLLAVARPVEEIRTLPLGAAAGRVLAEAQCSALAVPALDQSTVDGYALRPGDLAAGARLPLARSGTVLPPGQAAWIATGAPIPVGAEAVVMQEDCRLEEDGLAIERLPQAGENIRRAGEDIAAGGEILAAGIRLRAQELALAAAAGLSQLPVYRRLRVAIFFGHEDGHPAGEAQPPAAIYDSNRFALRALLESLNCEVRELGPLPQDPAAARAALQRAAGDNDLLVASGAFALAEPGHPVRSAVEALGRLEVWQLAIKPGRVLAFGQIASEGGRESWFVGLPDRPVANFLTFLLLVRPFILRLSGVREVVPRTYAMRADFDWPGDARTEFLRARIDPEGGLELFHNQGGGVVTSLTWGEGIVHNPPLKAIKAGDTVRFLPFLELLS